MRLRRLHLPLLVVLGAAMVVLPAIATSETPGISAYNEPGVYGLHSWMPSTAMVSPGGVVKFSNPYSEVPHGLQFTGGTAGTAPSCSGIPVAAGEASGATNWKGECTFSKPGTYTFICTVHPTEMKGTITVNPNGTTTGAPPGMTPTSPPPTTTTPPMSPSGESGSGPATGSPLVGGASKAIKFVRAQRGMVVRGSAQISQAGVGGRLEVDLLAGGASLAKTGHPAQVRVGRLLRSSLRAGSVSFSVFLSAKGKAALRRHRRLALTVRIVLTPTHGAAVTVTRAVVVRV